MKTTVTGATGLLGRSVMEELAKSDGFKVTGLGFSRAEPPLVKLDLMDKTALRRYFRNEKADIIVHCAAERRPDVSREKPEESRILNVAVSEQIAGIAAELEREEGGNFDNWATRYPTCTSDVAGVITQILKYRSGYPGFSGIFQWSGDGPIQNMKCNGNGRGYGNSN